MKGAGFPAPPTYGVVLRLFHAAILALTLSCGAMSVRAEPLKVVVLGDSLSAGYELPADAAFPAVLQRELRKRGHDVTVVNAGVSGDTSNGGLERLDWALGEDTDAAIVELGANDMLRGLDPAITRKALDEILTRLNARNIPALLAGMVAAPGMGAVYEKRFNAIFPELAERHKVVFYPFFLEGVAQEPKYKLADGMHPNREGVEEIVRRILPVAEALLQKAAAKAPQARREP